MYPPHLGVTAKKKQMLIAHKFSYISNKIGIACTTIQVAFDFTTKISTGIFTTKWCSHKAHPNW